MDQAVLLNVGLQSGSEYNNIFCSVVGLHQLLGEISANLADKY